MNKPAGYLSSKLTLTDKRLGKKSVFELIKSSDELDSMTIRTLVCAGRLDEGTTGLLIITNDGGLTHELTIPSAQVTKTYEAKLKKPLSDDDLKLIRAGVKIKLEENGKITIYKTKPAKLVASDSNKLLITLSEGKKREVKRIFEAVGNKVISLTRIKIGRLDLSNLELRPGEYKLVTKEFINQLIL
jgi:pseudouridine synthase